MSKTDDVDCLFFSSTAFPFAAVLWFIDGGF